MCDDYITVPLTRGQSAIIDKADATLVSTLHWHAVPWKGGYYACNVRNAEDGSHIRTTMHDFIMQCSDGMRAKHIDGNMLNNRRANLRLTPIPPSRYRKYPPITVPTDPGVLGYIAGIIDGEGHIQLRQQFDQVTSRGYSVATRLTVVNCDARLMQWLESTIGGRSRVADDHPERGWRPRHAWTLSSDNMRTLLRAILPYLVIKREQAEIILSLPAAKRDPKENRIADDVAEARRIAVERMAQLNKRGGLS